MTQLPVNPLGSTGLQVTALGFGAAPLGNLYHPVSDEDAAKTITASCGSECLISFGKQTRL